MESLLRLSGLLSEEDSEKTDLGALEKRLADRSVFMSTKNSTAAASSSTNPPPNNHAPPSHHSTPRGDSHQSPKTTVTSPESQRESEPEVDTLSDMMCSLVTSNSGETRYIGMSLVFCPGGMW